MEKQEIFKAYDIRGAYPDDIDEEKAYKIASAFIRFLDQRGEISNRQIVVGRDMRLSSDALFESLTQGLVNQGVDVVDIGVVSTPFLYWAVISQKAAGGIMITASHNPAQYNGFKLCGFGASPIGENSGLSEIKDFFNKEIVAPANALSGRVIKKNLLSEYINFIKTNTNLEKIKPQKIFIDCGNGTMGAEISEVIKGLPLEVKIIFGEPDGNFPNHEANPLKEETLKTLKDDILSNKADMGIAFDGDGDRLVFLDEKARTIRGDFITLLLAQHVLSGRPGQKIIIDVRSSRILQETILDFGGLPIIGKVGHSLIKEQMRKENISFGGELSGHYFFKEIGFVDNALFAMIKVLEIISESKKSLSQLIGPFKKYFQSGEINFEVKNPNETLLRAEQIFGDAKIQKIDGLTVEKDNWWFNLRKSNTEPLVRLNLEASTKELLDEKLDEIRKIILNK